jgi:hypothetical protein
VVSVRTVCCTLVFAASFASGNLFAWPQQVGAMRSHCLATALGSGPTGLSSPARRMAMEAATVPPARMAFLGIGWRATAASAPTLEFLGRPSAAGPRPSAECAQLLP